MSLCKGFKKRVETFNLLYFWIIGAVVVVIIWKLDLELPMQSVAITTNIVSSNPVHDEVYWIHHYVIKSVTLDRLGTPVSSTNTPNPNYWIIYEVIHQTITE